MKRLAIAILLSMVSVAALGQQKEKKSAPLTASVGGTATAPTVTLSWVPSNGCVPPATGTGNCTAVTSFIILRSATSGTETSYATVPIGSLVTCPTGTPPNNTQCWTDAANLSPGSTYFYKVESVNQGGAAAASNEASAAIAPVLTIPNPVGSLTATQP
jgi:hypothetical protein